MGIFDAAIPDRYEKNPMFIVLENYVLDSIGELEPEKYAKLNEILTKTFGGTDWKKTIRETYDLPPETDANLQQLWKQRQAEADLKQETLTPDVFARQVVDEMFSNLGGG
jgi:hypothetical protein